MRIVNAIAVLLVVGTVSVTALAQRPTANQEAQAQTAFEIANTAMEKRNYTEALTNYKKALAVLPDEPAILFNGGLAAYSTKDYNFALDLWKHLKELEPSDWHVRAKLVQVYQALGKLPERDAQRQELLEMWKSGKPVEFKEQFQYCRDQFEVDGKKVMAFEHFELKGDRALRYVFSILNDKGDDEAFRISLGSYEMTNAVWRETRTPKPREGERLFHLDGYFPGGHATYGMYFPEPSYDEVRSKVIEILEAKTKPISTTTLPGGSKPEVKPKP